MTSRATVLRALTEKDRQEQETAPEPLLISIAAAAGMLGISPPMVRKLLHNGELQGRHCGRRHMVALASVRTYAGAAS